jgi:hypothetical protein
VQYQETITSLQAQLSEARQSQHDLQRQLNAERMGADAPKEPKHPRGSVSFGKPTVA